MGKMTHEQSKQILKDLNHGEMPGHDLIQKLQNMCSDALETNMEKKFKRVFKALWALATFFLYFVCVLLTAINHTPEEFNPSLNPFVHPWLTSFWLLLSGLIAMIVWTFKLRDS